MTGTTLKVYKFMMKQRGPVGISQVQRALALSSSSVSEYHIQKLRRLGLVREEGGGYVIDRVVLDNVLRIRRVAIPIQVAYTAFFGMTLFFQILLKPGQIGSAYFLGVAVNVFALAICVYEAAKTMRGL